ncbi:oxygenase MpaB family protein [Marinobacterium litorale]|uniref:oxygenase MpaB family protein n=1 Tax=Marinobacterium litorale TaxID=404770 RepID=UPI0004204AFC|nr:oxygenase MpaB family protein [Marinobacterium litorale]
MEFIRRRIEQQVFNLTGLALNQIDYETPAGDPGLFGPDAICWRVHADFPSMLCGGIGALMLQMLHPLALAGVWDHSSFREDMIGRLRRTSQFIAGTTFAATEDARWLIERVREIHSHVSGYAPDGRAYSANDPELLTWVHVAEVRSFMAGYLRYGDPTLSTQDQDHYFAEVALVAEALGARNVPRNRGQIESYIDQMRPQLCFDQRTAEVLQLLLAAPSPNIATKPVAYLMARAGLDLLPDWACEMAGIELSSSRRRLIQSGMQALAPCLRWALRNGVSRRAKRRMGLA